MRAMRTSLMTRVGSAGAVAILATGGVLATATAAGAATHKAKPAETTLSIKNKAIAKGKHHADSITGVLKTRKHAAVVGATITLDSRTGKKPRWAAVATGTTGSGGSVTFTVAPTVKTQYKLVFAGTSSFKKSHSNVITLKAVKS